MVEAIILAGGAGRRLYPVTRKRPKAFIRIGGRMLYEYTLDLLREARGSIDNIIIIAPRGYSHLMESVPEWVTVVEQKWPGVSGALRTGMEAVSGQSEVVVSFIGYLAKPPTLVTSLLDYYSTSSHPVVVSAAPISSGLETFGFVKIGVGDRVDSISSSAGPEWLGGRGYVFAGALVGEASFVKALSEYDFVDGLSRLARKGLVGAYTWTGEWIEVSYPWDLLSLPYFTVYNMPLLLSNRASISRSATIIGPVVVEPDAVVGEGAIVQGPVYIGEGARIGENAVVGPGVIVEAKSSIEPFSIVRDSILLENVRIGSYTRLEYSIASEGARIGSYVLAEPCKPKPRYEWVEEATRRSESIKLGIVAGPEVNIPHRSHRCGDFIE